jgi:hypothetical protein
MYNALEVNIATGLKHYIDDLNTRFTNLLFKNIEGYTANYLTLARLDINGLPMSNDSESEYIDGLMDDNYSLVISYIESADRKDVGEGFEATIDLICSANMEKFNGYKEEGIINEVYNIMKVWANVQAISRDENALKGITNKIPDSMYPFFVFRIKSKLTGTYKVN